MTEHKVSWVAKFPRRIQQAFDRFPRIRSDREIMSGTPCVVGTRVPVWVVAGLYAAGVSSAMIAWDYGISESDVFQAVQFVRQLGRIDNIKFWKFYRASPAESKETKEKPHGGNHSVD